MFVVFCWSAFLKAFVFVLHTNTVWLCVKQDASTFQQPPKKETGGGFDCNGGLVSHRGSLKDNDDKMTPIDSRCKYSDSFLQ